MAFRPEDHVVPELRYAIYAAITLHFLRKILGKVFVRDERVPGKDGCYVVEISPGDLARYDSRYDFAIFKFRPRDRELTPSILGEAVMQFQDVINRCPDVINSKRWSE